VEKQKTKPAVGLEVFVFLTVFYGIFVFLGSRMGAVNMLNTMMNTGYQLLIDTVFYILAIAVLAGAISGLFTEFGVVALINKMLSPLMKPLYNLPGASIIGVLATYLSDNPAILTLADQTEFRRYFKKYHTDCYISIYSTILFHKLQQK
jgi:nucleoside recognition membrane protein YjiH